MIFTFAAWFSDIAVMYQPRSIEIMHIFYVQQLNA